MNRPNILPAWHWHPGPSLKPRRRQRSPPEESTSVASHRRCAPSQLKKCTSANCNPTPEEEIPKTHGPKHQKGPVTPVLLPASQRRDCREARHREQARASTASLSTQPLGAAALEEGLPNFMER